MPGPFHVAPFVRFPHAYPPVTDLLFYDREAGFGEFYATNEFDARTIRIYDPGNPRWLRTYDLWRKSWTHIVPGNFGGGGIDDLLFYERAAGFGEFYAYDIYNPGKINWLSTYDGWRPSWTHIIPGNFGGSGFTDLLFYERDTGYAEFHTTDGQGNPSVLRTHDYWRKSWTQIIPGNFGGSGFTDLLFYERAAGFGEFYTTDGAGGMSWLRTHDNWRPSWTQIVPLRRQHVFGQ
jgi:hypothetical protein